MSSSIKTIFWFTCALTLGFANGFLFGDRDAKAYPREPLVFWGEKLKAWCNLTETGSSKASSIHLGMRIENRDKVEKEMAPRDLEKVGDNVFAWVPIDGSYFKTAVNHLSCFDNQRYIEGTIIFVERPLENVKDVSVERNVTNNHLTVRWSPGAEYLTWNSVHTDVKWAYTRTRLSKGRGKSCQGDASSTCLVKTCSKCRRFLHIRFNVTVPVDSRPDPEYLHDPSSSWTSQDVKVDLETMKVTYLETSKERDIIIK